MNRAMTKRAALLLALATTATACTTGAKSIGSNSLVGTWEGYVENYTFKSGSDALELTIASESGGAVTGKVRFGGGPLLAPPTDPDKGYPAGIEYGGTGQKPIEGFEYTMLSTKLSSARLQFDIDRFEVWRAWCELQTPVYAYGQYGCMPSWDSQLSPQGCYLIDPATTTHVPIDCGKLVLCAGGGVCKCDSMKCEVAPGDKVNLDVAFNGNDADGSVIIGADARDLHMTRTH